MTDNQETEEELAQRRLAALKGPKPEKRNVVAFAIPVATLVSGIAIGVWLAVGGASDAPLAPAPITSTTSEFQSTDGEAGFTMTRPREDWTSSPEVEIREVQVEADPDPALAEMAEQIEAMRVELANGKEEIGRLGTDLDAALSAVAEKDSALSQAELEKAELLAQFGSQPEMNFLDAGEAEREAQRLAELEARRQQEAERREQQRNSPAVAYRRDGSGGGNGGANADPAAGFAAAELAALDAARERSPQERADAFMRAGASAVQITRAQVIANPGNTIAQGTQIEAALITGLSSDLPGPVIAQVSRDVWSMDMGQVLIPRGSKLYGRYSSDVERGQRRILIAWDRVTTTDGQSAELEAYGTDRIGRSGMTGKVRNHTLSRFGAAAAVSVIGALPTLLAAGIEEDQNGSVRGETYSNLGQSVSESVGQAMAGSLDRPPTITVQQGAVVMVRVNTDLEIW